MYVRDTENNISCKLVQSTTLDRFGKMRRVRGRRGVSSWTSGLTCDVQRSIAAGGHACPAPGYAGVDTLVRLTPPAPPHAQEEDAPL